ncbi:MAG: nucleotidyltransferase family protein [Bacteroidales bacterium]|nr:nucleotidyltransferase family protein [Bacteroidales bacterium]
MKAMILAAGFGTRLKPITDSVPKALVPLAGKPMIEWIIDNLVSSGFSDIVVNVHHFSRMMKEYLSGITLPGAHIMISDESEKILDTGGALFRARQLLDDGYPFLVHNTDIFSDIDLKDLYDFHCRNGNDVTLAVRNRKTSRSLLIDRNGWLKGWRNNITGETILVSDTDVDLIPVAFSGIHVAGPSVFSMMGDREVFPLIPYYLRLAENYKVAVYFHNEGTWIDMGNLEGLKQAEVYLVMKKLAK